MYLLGPLGDPFCFHSKQKLFIQAFTPFDTYGASSSHFPDALAAQVWTCSNDSGGGPATYEMAQHPPRALFPAACFEEN